MSVAVLRSICLRPKPSTLTLRCMRLRCVWLREEFLRYAFSCYRAHSILIIHDSVHLWRAVEIGLRESGLYFLLCRITGHSFQSFVNWYQSAVRIVSCDPKNIIKLRTCLREEGNRKVQTIANIIWRSFRGALHPDLLGQTNHWMLLFSFHASPLLALSLATYYYRNPTYLSYTPLGPVSLI